MLDKQIVSSSVCQYDGKEITTAFNFNAFVDSHGLMGLSKLGFVPQPSLRGLKLNLD